MTDGVEKKKYSYILSNCKNRFSQEIRPVGLGIFLRSQAIWRTDCRCFVKAGKMKHQEFWNYLCAGHPKNPLS